MKLMYILHAKHRDEERFRFYSQNESLDYISSLASVLQAQKTNPMETRLYINLVENRAKITEIIDKKRDR